MQETSTPTDAVTRRGLLLGGLVAAGGVAALAGAATAQSEHQGHPPTATPI